MRRVSMRAARLMLGLGLAIASGAARADGDAARGEKRFLFLDPADTKRFMSSN